jgi:hypothetical protein
MFRGSIIGDMAAGWRTEGWLAVDRAGLRINDRSGRIVHGLRRRRTALSVPLDEQSDEDARDQARTYDQKYPGGREGKDTAGIGAVPVLEGRSRDGLVNVHPTPDPGVGRFRPGALLVPTRPTIQTVKRPATLGHADLGLRGARPAVLANVLVQERRRHAGPAGSDPRPAPALRLAVAVLVRWAVARVGAPVRPGLPEGGLAGLRVRGALHPEPESQNASPSGAPVAPAPSIALSMRAVPGPRASFILLGHHANPAVTAVRRSFKGVGAVLLLQA